MLIFLIAIFIVSIIGIKIARKNEFFVDYCSPKQTGAINVIFSFLIILSHSCQYITLNNSLDSIYLDFRKLIGQLVVCTFLFYSGYGMMFSICKNGKGYVKSIPSKRFFKVWYHFAIALLPYIALNFIFDNGYSSKNIALSFLGIKAVGNSNWYMFVVFVFYWLIFISFSIFKKSKISALFLLTVLTVAFGVIEYKLGFADRYMNTLLCFVAGMYFAYFKKDIDAFIMKNNLHWIICVLGCVAIILCVARFRDKNVIIYNLFASFSAIFVVLITMKFKISNKILSWFSAHIFSFFILQRIPMIIFKNIGLNQYKYLFVILCLIATIPLAVLFDYIVSKTDKLIYSKKR